MPRNIKAGKITLPMDVRSSNDIPAFENMLSKGPMAVLVYADWCGHCDKYKKNVWSPLKSTKNRTVNMASVHYDQLENTSLKDSKIDGYPSLLLVGQDKKPATFNTENGATNALPNANDINTMKSVVTSPKANTVSSLNVSQPTNITNENSVNVNSATPLNVNSVNANSATPLNVNSATLANSVNLLPPNIEGDEVSETPAASPRVKTNNQGVTPLLRGGRLYKKLSSKKHKSRRSTRKTKRSRRKQH